MAIPLNHSLPPEVQGAIEVIYDFLEKSLWKEIRITLSHQITGVAKSGDTPSPPAAQDEQEHDSPGVIRNKRKAAASANRNGSKKKPKHAVKPLAEIGAVLRVAKGTAPTQEEDPLGSLSDCFGQAVDVAPEDMIWGNHMFGKKLRQEEDNYPTETPVGKKRRVAEQFRNELPHLHEKHRKDYLKYARRIYQVTSLLTPNQVRQILDITWWDLARLSQKDIQQVRSMYQ